MVKGRYVAEIEFLTPYVAGYYKEYYTFRIFKKGNIELILDKFNVWRAIDKIKELYEMGVINRSDVIEIIEKIENEKNRTPDKSVEYYRMLKKALEKNKFFNIDFMFPRDGLLNIDLHKAMIRGVYFALGKTGGWDVKNIVEIKPKVIIYGTYVMFVSNTNAPVVHETIEPGSIVEVVFEAKNEGEKEFETNLGRMRRLGFGRARFKIKKHS